MKNLKSSLLGVALIAGLSTASMSANAQAVPLEQAIAQTVLVQGQRLVAELGTELEKNIKQEISEFSVDASSFLFSTEAVANNKQESKESETKKSEE